MAMAKITMSLGLVSFGAKLDTATVAKESLRNLCVGAPGQPAHDPKPLKQPSTCSDCGVITDYSAIVKGIPQGADTFAIVTQEDVAKAKSEALTPKGQVALVPHPAGDFLGATSAGAKSYYVVPDPGAENHYALIVKYVTEHPEIALTALYTPRSATGLYRLTVRDSALVLEERTREQSLKPAPSTGGLVNDQLYTVLESIVAATTAPYEAEAYEDTYKAALAALAAAAQVVGTGSTSTTATPKPVAQSDDALLAALLAQLTTTTA